MTFVGIGMLTLQTRTSHLVASELVAFYVADTDDKDAARGDWTGKMNGIVRPLLEWDTEFTPLVSESPSELMLSNG